MHTRFYQKNARREMKKSWFEMVDMNLSNVGSPQHSSMREYQNQNRKLIINK